MEQTLKQRLIGAGVIVALGVVFIPMFLDGSGEKVVREIPLPPAQKEQAKPGMVKPEAIPVPDVIKPEIKPVNNDHTPPVAPPAASGVTSSGKIAAATGEQKTETAKTDAVKAPVPAVKAPVVQVSGKTTTTQKADTPPTKAVVATKAANSAAPKSWVVQVGSFTENSKAIKLRDQLRKKKYRAFVENVTTSPGKSMYRVRIGPDLKRADAETVMNKLLKEEKIKGYVTHHP